MARKFQIAGSSRADAAIAAINLRMATIQLAGLRVPPRAGKIPAVRRRLPVTVFPGAARPVIIRHALQNLGGAVVSEIQPSQSPRA
jgi:hypothetical protein